MAHSASRPPESVQGKLFMEDSKKTQIESDRLCRLLKSPIFVVQKASEPNFGVEFDHKSIGAIRYSLVMLYDDVRCLQRVPGGWVCKPIVVIGFAAS